MDDYKYELLYSVQQIQATVHLNTSTNSVQWSITINYTVVLLF